MYGVYRKDKLIATIRQVSDEKAKISADKEYYVEWLAALISSPLIDKNKILKLNIKQILKDRLYKPFTSKLLKKQRRMKINKVVKYAL